MTIENRRKAQLQAGRKLAELAEEAVQAFREKDPEAFRELTSVFEGRSADIGLLGIGGFHVAVQKQSLSIEPNEFRGNRATAHGVTSPETLLDIAEGRLTPLEAFFKGDLLVRAKSPDLHLAYDYFVKFADTALRNERLRDLLEKFRDEFGPATGTRGDDDRRRGGTYSRGLHDD
jgi:hypothetical protein